ncbi:MAG: hypothetical protein HGA75_01450 [Thiobacillus sp.]|nr:hypothetical protein [Thiobacillus sp.]
MKEDIASRRDWLRGALALGVSLLLPGPLTGCDARKSAQTGSNVPAAVPSPVAPASAPPPGPPSPAGVKKLEQAVVHYQDQPKGEKRCVDCMHFIAESNTCKLVEGSISPLGWCSLWAKKV